MKFIRQTKRGDPKVEARWLLNLYDVYANLSEAICGTQPLKVYHLDKMLHQAERCKLNLRQAMDEFGREVEDELGLGFRGFDAYSSQCRDKLRAWCGLPPERP